MMNTYKITNITNRLAKRDRKFNVTLAIEYVDKMTKKTISIKPNDSVFLSVSTLPLSVHRLRIKNLITVSEVNPAEAIKAAQKVKPVKKKATPKPKAAKKPVEKKLVAVVTEEKATTPKKGRPAKNPTN